jgi:hypothetical protein
MSSRRARHGHLPDSRRESPMLRLNPAIAMVRPKPTSHPAAACQGGEHRSLNIGSGANTPGRVGRPIKHSGRNLQPSPGCPTREAATENLAASLSQPPHEYGQGIRPKDATDKEARTPRSRGRSVVVLYNNARPHSQLGWKTTSEFAFTCIPRRDLALRYADGSAPAPVATTAHSGKSTSWSELKTG